MDGIKSGEFSRERLNEIGIRDLRQLAFTIGVHNFSSYNKADLIEHIIAVVFGFEPPKTNAGKGRPVKAKQSKQEIFEKVLKKIPEPNIQVSTIYQNKGIPLPVPFVASSSVDYETGKKLEDREGILEIVDDGYGFLRAENCEASKKDCYVTKEVIRKNKLLPGDYVVGKAFQAYTNRMPALEVVEKVNGSSPQHSRSRFESFVPTYPFEKIVLEQKNNLVTRTIDLLTPIGKGQRALIVSPPKVGKTTILKSIAESVCKKNPEICLIVLLVDERPEEVTDIRDAACGEIFFSTFDQTPEHHIKVSELALERAKRLVEIGKDVVILLDSITRLTRACNLTGLTSGKELSGGLDPAVMQFPKKFFGAARKIKNGGSLTIVATALVETGNKMDDLIFEEFKGTGNMELHLSRRLAEKRIFPAIDIGKSNTRKEELLFSEEEKEGAWLVRKVFASGDPDLITEQLFLIMKKTKNNKELVASIGNWFKNV